jgi:tRNA (guanosine-2'-O-)-methyltransferase
MNKQQNRDEKVLGHLFSFLSDHKKQKMEQVLDWRTRHVTVVLEDMFQPHNASAVLRSCDILGVQDLHVVESRNPFVLMSGVAMGASKWLDMHRYKEIQTCIQKLKWDGYRIVATVPGDNATPLPDLDISTKLALFFGSEYSGLSQVMIDEADERLVIPMFGFTESFNVSVSVAICLQNIMARLHDSQIKWRLTESERQHLLLQWVRKAVRNAQALELQIP